jgi:hypothetical protein
MSSCDVVRNRHCLGPRHGYNRRLDREEFKQFADKNPTADSRDDAMAGRCRLNRVDTGVETSKRLVSGLETTII